MDTLCLPTGEWLNQLWWGQKFLEYVVLRDYHFFKEQTIHRDNSIDGLKDKYAGWKKPEKVVYIDDPVSSHV